jgi:hypothetical protein
MVVATRGPDPQGSYQLERNYIVEGTIVCGVSDIVGARGALKLAHELSERLGLRLVLAHIAEGFEPTDQGSPDSSLSTDWTAAPNGVRRLATGRSSSHGSPPRRPPT